jgi:hypothetical protein
LPNVPAGIYTQVTVGGSFNVFVYACGLMSGGSVICWGTGLRGETEGPTAQFAQISAGQTRDSHIDFVCGLSRTGPVVCLGASASLPAGIYTQVSAGDGFACGLLRGGKIVCPVQGGGYETRPGAYTAVSAGDGVCGLKRSGKVVCWDVPGLKAFPAGTYTRVSVGEDGAACALRKTGLIVCAGGGRPSGRFSQVSAGEQAACGVKHRGKLVCWGTYPTPVPTGVFKQVSVGGGLLGPAFACGLKATGAIVCWGDNPGVTNVPAGSFKDVSAGADSACGLTAAGGVRCWGVLNFVLPAGT